MQKKQYCAPSVQSFIMLSMTQPLLSSPNLGLGGSTSSISTTPIVGQ